jgi:hypothetical protein
VKRYEVTISLLVDLDDDSTTEDAEDYAADAMSEGAAHSKDLQSWGIKGDADLIEWMADAQ